MHSSTLQPPAPTAVRQPGSPWSQRDAAHFLGVSLSTIERLVRSGALQSFRVGRRRLVPDAAVQQLVTGGPHPTAP